MLTKIKIALALCGSLLVGGAGMAAAQGVIGPSPAARAQRQAKREAIREKMLARYDLDKDGRLDKAERAAMRNERAEKAFTKADTDHDGRLTLAEFKTLRQHQGRHRGVRHHQGQGKRGRGPGGGGPSE